LLLAESGSIPCLGISQHLKESKAPFAAKHKLRTENHDQKTGNDIVRKALSTPARQIAINAGEDGSIVVGKISENDTYAYGYDAQEGESGNRSCVLQSGPDRPWSGR
jgi:chaperonin GroEL (HSP60 family)